MRYIINGDIFHKRILNGGQVIWVMCLVHIMLVFFNNQGHPRQGLSQDFEIDCLKPHSKKNICPSTLIPTTFNYIS